MDGYTRSPSDRFTESLIRSRSGRPNQRKADSRVNLRNNSVGGALKERQNRRAGKRSSKHLKMDNNKLSTKKQQLDFQGKIHTCWIKAACDSRFCVLDVSEQKRTLWSSQTDCQCTARLTGIKLPRITGLCFNIIMFVWNRKHTHSHEDKDGLLEAQRSDLR